jgi:RNA polymerase sigma factor (sigma-70 family)
LYFRKQFKNRFLQETQQDTTTIVEHFFRHEYGKVVSHLTSKYGVSRIEQIEDAVQEALIKAMNTWPYTEIPRNPAGWIMQVSRNHLIDLLRRSQKMQDQGDDFVFENSGEASDQEELLLDSEIKDDQLRMIFACCHPALPVEIQIMLVLKLICGLGKWEIAAALLKNEDTVAKALTRAKAKLKEEVEEFEVPIGKELTDKLEVVYKIMYLLFNEGYSSTQGDLVKKDLCFEAIRLSVLLTENKHSNTPKLNALIALCCFQASRLDARVNESGELLTLEEQDRNLWDRDLIALGTYHLSQAADGSNVSDYHLQASIAWFHCSAKDYDSTDWQNILGLYNVNLQYNNSPIIALNRAVPLAKVEGPESALKTVLELENEKVLKNYYLFYAIKAELLKDTGNTKAAIACIQQAAELTLNATEKQYLQRKLQKWQS